MRCVVRAISEIPNDDDGVYERPDVVGLVREYAACWRRSLSERLGRLGPY